MTHLKHWNGQRVPGYYYSVRRGDTLASIAERFGCDLDLLAQMNDTRADRTLGAAERVFIPRLHAGYSRQYYAKPRRSQTRTSAAVAPGNRVQRTGQGLPRPALSGQPPRRPTVVMTPTPRAAVRPRATPSQFLPSNAPPTSLRPAFRQKGIEIAQSYTKRRLSRRSLARVPNAPRFQWPVGGVITSGFNARSTRQRLHMGIDIANKRGTHIRAAYSGRVLYSDSQYLPSMGNMVLIEHPGGWVTLYAHNERNLVREGDYVETGEAIALMGSTGKATGPHLHFEIRKDADTPVNPLDYLPRSR